MPPLIGPPPVVNLNTGIITNAIGLLAAVYKPIVCIVVTCGGGGNPPGNIGSSDGGPAEKPEDQPIPDASGAGQGPNCPPGQNCTKNYKTCNFAAEIPTVVFRRGLAPGLARNFDDAVSAGAPTSLNRVADAARRANRRAALKGQQPAPRGMSLDEYPFASSAQGGAGACVSEVPVGEQHYQGGVLSSFYQKFGIGIGDAFNVLFVP